MIVLPVLETNSLNGRNKSLKGYDNTGGIEMDGNYSIVGVVVYFVLFLGIMYLLFFLPQRRREKKTKQMLEALRVGDEITTIGGISGKVLSMKDDELTIETAVEKTKINVKKWAIKEVKELIKA